MTALSDGDPTTEAVVEADTGRSLRYGELAERVTSRGADLLATEPDLAFLFADPTVDSVIDYLALRDRGVPVVLLDPNMPEAATAELIGRYRPAVIVNGKGPADGYRRSELTGPTIDVPAAPADEAEPIDWPEPVAVLLPTSGSTGNPKLVQLTAENLDVNAADIVTALAIDETDRGLAPLPLFYSYGLSVLNSHLAAGATTVLTAASPVRPEFWTVVEDNAVTSIPGVPYSYQMFRRVGLLDRELPSLRYLSQAGGKLDREDVLDFHRALSARGRRFHVMYGQTEAAPRMSTLAVEDLPDHAGSVGVALASGRFEIADPDDTGAGEVIYEGPNVMLGYADARADLGVRTHHGRLATGDLGRLDDGGRLTITGRLKRIAKLFGTRISLDDIERHLGGHAPGPIAAVEGHDTIVVFAEPSGSTEHAERTVSTGQTGSTVSTGQTGVTESTGPSGSTGCSGDGDQAGLDELRAEARQLARRLQVPPKTVRIAEVPSLPLNANGKIDYRSLRDAL